MMLPAISSSGESKGCKVVLQKFNDLAKSPGGTGLPRPLTTARTVFTGLEAGTYSVTETQPTGCRQGAANEAGSADGEVVGTDQYAEIDLTEGLEAEDYNFGERGLGASYIPRECIITVPEPSTFSALMTGLLLLAGLDASRAVADSRYRVF